ncbi:MAG: CPBP family intramembrane metalloprotease [Actinobacteria bacterium]|nr:CPBP family intramembrane metalloprotease [Actinomycetota bacterium]MCL6104396.1 CPBP family intramembrane metalloprotease [Actinomycetota bacterium]
MDSNIINIDNINSNNGDENRGANTGWVWIALIGLLIGMAIGESLILILSVIFPKLTHAAHGDPVILVVASLFGLWVGLIGACIFASKTTGNGHFIKDFGLEIKPATDIPIGILIGIASQLVLVPILYIPIAPFVHNFSQNFSKPARQLTANTQGASLILLAILTVVGAPIVEELFFRGLLFRGLRKAVNSWLNRPLRDNHYGANKLSLIIAVILSSVIFGLAHGEPLQALGLIAFGIILAVLAYKTSRLGPGIIAHASFNATAFVFMIRAGVIH